jgi:transposase-like protein
VANPTMEPFAVIRKHLEEAEPDLLRELLQGVAEALMGVEVDSLAGAAYRERSALRTNRRNGFGCGRRQP